MGVAFNGLQSKVLVKFGAVERSEDALGLDKLVEVPRDNDDCLLIRGENGADGILEQDELLMKTEQKADVHTRRL